MKGRKKINYRDVDFDIPFYNRMDTSETVKIEKISDLRQRI